MFRWLRSMVSHSRPSAHADGMHKEGIATSQGGGVWSFGINTSWLAVKTSDTAELCELLALRGRREANWSEGFDWVYGSKSLSKPLFDSPTVVFVTPAIDGWTCVVGCSDLTIGASGAELDERIRRVSERFEYACAFVNLRTVSRYGWSRAEKGVLIRSLLCNYEDVRTVGDWTESERSLGLHTARELCEVMNEDAVMALAADWTVDTGRLEETHPALPSGWLATIPRREVTLHASSNL